MFSYTLAVKSEHLKMILALLVENEQIHQQCHHEMYGLFLCF